MMYTPTPSARRPRPPSRTRQTMISGRSSDMRPTSTPSQRITAMDETPGIAQAKRRKELARSTLARVSASPDLGDVSMDLDVRTKAKHRAVGLGLPSSRVNRSPNSPDVDAEPSPPPPYGLGQDLPDSTTGHDEVPTPLRQDSGTSSRKSSVTMQDTIVDQIKVEERLRARRAIDAARAMGLEADFGTSGSEQWSMESEDDLSEGTLRARLLEMKRQLRRRDNELVLAAEVANRALETHERLLAHLPKNVQARLPDVVKLFSSLEQQEAPRKKVSTASLRHRRSIEDDAEQSYTTDSHDDFTTADDEPGPSHPLWTGHSDNSDENRYENRQSRPVRPKHISHTSTSSRYHPSPRQARMTAIQQEETDERIMALEQALNDAKESEENQRKLAARLRKEVDKLHRDFDRAEEEMEAEKSKPRGLVGTPGYREMSQGSKIVWNRRNPVEKSTRADKQELDPRRENSNQEVFGWGSMAFPQFPPGSAKPDKRLRRAQITTREEVESDFYQRSINKDGRRPAKSPAPSLPPSRSNSKLLDVYTPAKGSERDSTIRLTPSHQPSRSTHGRSSGNLTLPNEHRRVRKKISSSNFLVPGQTITPDANTRAPSPAPRLMVQAPRSPSDKSNSSESRVSSKIARSVSTARTMRRSPWPSPHGSAISGISGSSPNPRAHLEFASRQGSLSPAFASLSSRMASMRAYVTSALNASPTPETGRTLGSELGSEYGDRPESSLRIIEDALMLAGLSPSRTNISDMEIDRSAYSEGYCEPPAPLPPRVSAALSSLALALAPYASPHPRGPYPQSGPRYEYETERDSSSDRSGQSSGSSSSGDRNIFDDAFGTRKIRWADSQGSQDAGESTSTSTDDAAGDIESPAEASPVKDKEIVDTVFSARTGRSSTRSPAESLKLRLPSPRPRSRPRPGYLRYSSDGSIALAHRRRISQQFPFALTSASGGPTARMSKHEEVNERERDGNVWEEILTEDEEPRTIPGRVVHDIICLLAILVDFVECAIVIVYRVIMDLRYNRRSLSVLSRRAKMKRYYL